jgi:hypothetical protein
MMTPREHYTLLVAYALYIVFLGVAFCYAIPEAVTYLIGGTP